MKLTCKIEETLETEIDGGETRMKIKTFVFIHAEPGSPYENSELKRKITALVAELQGEKI